MKVKRIVFGVIVLLVAIIVAAVAVLLSLDPEDYRAEIEAEAEAALGRKLSLEGPIDLKISLTPALSVEQARLANADWGSRPDMATMKHFELEIAVLPLLQNELRVNRVVLVEPDILLETNAKGVGNWEFGRRGAAEEEPAGAAPGEGKGLTASVGALVIERGRVTYRDGVTGEEHRVYLETLSAEADSPSDPLGLSLEGEYQDLQIGLRGEIGSINSLRSGDEAIPIDLTGNLGDAEWSASGSIGGLPDAPRPDLKVTLSASDLASFGAVAGAQLPALGALSFQGQITTEEDEILVQGLALELGDSRLDGDLRLATVGKRPKLSGTLTSPELDLRKFAAAADAKEESAEASTGAGQASPYVFPDQPLPLDALKAIDTELDISVDKLILDDAVTLTSFELPVKLSAGKMALDPIKAGLSGGTIDARLSLDAGKSTPPVSLAVKASKVDYGQMLKDAGISNDVEGKLDLDSDLQGAGSTPRAIASGLNGHFMLTGDEGVIDNRLLKLIGTGLDQVLGPLLGSNKQSNLNCLVADFAVTGGVAQSRALAVDSESFTVAGGGIVDLRTEKLDLAFDTSTRTPSIASLAVPFTVRGTLKQPSVAPDPVGTALGAAKAAGVIINPVAAVGLLVGESMVSGSDENPCVVAVDAAADTGATGSASEPAESGSLLEEVPQQVEEGLKGIGEGIKSLFGN